MRRSLILVTATLALLAVTPPGPLRGQATITRDVALSEDGRLHELTISSAALNTSVNARVLLPHGYDAPANATRRYPVLYLLHGVSASSSSWTERTNVEEQTAALDVIVVMPDGGRSGWYTDWVDGPGWESFHIGELVPLVDATYRTEPIRSRRAVMGMSMGGFGTMSYAARHPDLFGFAAAFSGFVDTTTYSVAGGLGFDLLNPQFNTPTERVWGPFVGDEVRWRGHNPVDLATNLRNTTLVVRTGNGVITGGDQPQSGLVESFVYLANVSFHNALTRAGLAHTWFDRGHGTHEWHYWQDDLAAALPAALAMFSTLPVTPASFEHRTIEPTFDVYGWTFAARRAVIEFLDLTRVSTRGLTARGSGVLEVTSPPAFEPGATYAVGNDEVVADRDGRLQFIIDLGPSHDAEQYTPRAIAAELAAGAAYWRTATVTIEPVGRPGTSTTPAPRPAGGSLPATGASTPPLHAAAMLLAALAVRATVRRGRARGDLRGT